ncbi:diamine N-acetyltransferase [Flavobacteriaceae bacterium MAR_2010_72]|nr:diamine N-acetyltransferase [Flavobacteriaceae bacterium MAR_2010_72]TVZ59403.1 diamine N-acetyltransferase [Flavobacteriaceae bacterium MAR_2010_105]
MLTLKGEHINLRALEPEDLEFVYEIENDETIWEISNTIAPFSRFTIKQYLENSHKDIFEVKQLRLVIAAKSNKALGLIDIFDFDFLNRRAGVGILIKDSKNRQKGYGSEALHLLIAYCKTHLNLHQLYCNVSEDNQVSLKLFQKLGFKVVGLKKDWNHVKGAFKNEYLLQHIFN